MLLHIQLVISPGLGKKKWKTCHPIKINNQTPNKLVILHVIDQYLPMIKKKKKIVIKLIFACIRSAGNLYSTALSL
jgi:hypothetical protein